MICKHLINNDRRRRFLQTPNLEMFLGIGDKYLIKTGQLFDKTMTQSLLITFRNDWNNNLAATETYIS